MDCVFKCREVRKSGGSPFDRIVYLIRLELVDWFLQVPKNFKSEEERKQERKEGDSKLSGSGPLASGYAPL